MIVKVQLPIAVSDNHDACALVYDEKRKVVLHVPVSRVLLARMTCSKDHPHAVSGATLKKLLPNEEQPFAPHYAAKKYFKADLEGKGSKSLELDAEVADQPW